MSTYKDLQRLTGLSLATISKYYNGRSVLAANARAIEEAAATLDFRPNTIARNLRSGRSRTVGVLLPDLNSSFYLSILAGIELRLRQRGVSMLICADHSAEGGVGDAVRELAGRMVDGVITVPTERAAPGLRELVARGTPIVMMDWIVEGLEADAVILDNQHAGAMAIQQLIDRGHRDIAYIGGNGSPTLIARGEGVRAQLALRGRPVREEYLAAPDLSVEGARAAMQRFLMLEDRPTAVFCATDLLSVGALIALNESGLRVPQDMSFIGFDMSSLARLTTPALDTISQRIDEIASTAADLMLARLGPHPSRDPITVTMSADYHAGGSVATLRERESV
ncbi:LacI family DNA-binding transcriptional regulator [Ruania alba]|uniref:Transcriptional regulator, LacI family n=1 Tax=Ruania alba TaxID=648782 RepID=A0A1H5MVX7_9MICO|nr:LacI family DNA-binding transcriptional regulator [Ruania alba]SEE93504.1 transcriptional regulator, LacI family [Ruania alba]